VLLLGLGGAIGCGSYPTLRDDPINCAADGDYEFDPNEVPARNCSGDSTAGHDPNAIIDPSTTMDGGTRCGSPQAVVIRLSHYNDWGASCGFYDGWNPTARNEADYDGLSFWARAPGDTSKAFTISISDANTTTKAQGGNCVEYNVVDGGMQGPTFTNYQDPSNPGGVISGAGLTGGRLPDECGNNTRTNAYSYVMSVTAEWDFYTIPFSRFTQAAYANRVPNSVLTQAGDVPGTGLLTSEIFGFDIRPPKETAFELWLDKIRFYRKKAAGADAAAGPVGSGGAPSGAGGAPSGAGGAPSGAGGAPSGAGGAPSGAGGSTGFTGNDGVACPVLTNALITDFTYTPVDGGATDFVHFGDSSTLAGTESVYPASGNYPVTSDVTQSNWHLSGTLGDYSGFRLNIDNCSRIDASAYSGIQFTISGSVPQGNIVTLGMGTLKNTIASDWLIANADTGAKPSDPGRCVPTSGTSRYNQPTCADAKKDISVTATPTVVKVLWNDFTGGKPEPNVTPADITSIYWYFPNPTGVGTTSVVPYSVDIVIDDLQFIKP
jgi:hypothetical protein